MKNLPAEIKAQAVYTGFVYEQGVERTLPGSEWKALAKRTVEGGGRIERDADGDIAIYGAGREGRIAEIYQDEARVERNAGLTECFHEMDAAHRRAGLI